MKIILSLLLLLYFFNSQGQISDTSSIQITDGGTRKIDSTVIFSGDSAWLGESDVTTGLSPLRILSKNVGYAGSTLEVELLIAVSPYMRQKMIVKEGIPKGFGAEVIETSGGDFSINGQRVIFKFKRYEGPDTLMIKYKLLIPEKIKGEFEIQGHVFGGKAEYFAGLNANMVMIPSDGARSWNFNMGKSVFTVKQGVRLKPIEGTLNE